jgi:hypothetical protein
MEDSGFYLLDLYLPLDDAVVRDTHAFSPELHEILHLPSCLNVDSSHQPWSYRHERESNTKDKNINLLQYCRR